MARLKNITLGSVVLQMFSTPTPSVDFVSTDVILSLKPGEDVDQDLWLVSDPGDSSYNSDIIQGYINSGILSRIPA